MSQVNLNDGSVEGLRHATKPIETVQYHPEAAPGPRDVVFRDANGADHVAKDLFSVAPAGQGAATTGGAQ